jgi:hypothetical protein
MLANTIAISTTKRPRGTIAWRLILPVPLMLIAATVAIWLVVPRIIAGNATEDAVRASQQTATQFKTIRAYYTDNVVNKVLKGGAMKPAFDHKGNDKAIPRPERAVVREGHDHQSLQPLSLPQPQQPSAR